MDAVMIDNLDNLYYINDIFELEIQEFNEEIGDLLLRIVLLPIVIGGFTSYDRKPYHISISLSTYILIQTIQMLKYKPLIDTLVATIFLTEICEEIIELILDPPPLIIIKRDKRSIDTLKIGFFMIEALDNLEKPESLIANPVRTVLLSFLRSRDDTLVTLILKLIDVVM